MSRAAIGRRGFAAAVALLGLSAPALAAPRQRSVTLIVGAPAGSPADRVGRSVVPFLARHWQRVSVVVENLAGNGGMETARHVADAEGQSVLGLVSTPGLLARCIQSAEPALPDRLMWLGPIAEEPMLLAARAGQGAATLVSARGTSERLIGCGPLGSASHLATLQLTEALVSCRALPFASPVAAARAAATGHVAAAMLSSAEFRRAATPGLGPIATATTSRLADYPSVPTLAERGIPLVAGVQRGLVAPPGFAGATRLAAALRAMREDPEFLDWAQEAGARPGAGEPAEWLRALSAERSALSARWARGPWMSAG